MPADSVTRQLRLKTGNQRSRTGHCKESLRWWSWSHNSGSASTRDWQYCVAFTYGADESQCPWGGASSRPPWRTRRSGGAWIWVSASWRSSCEAAAWAWWLTSHGDTAKAPPCIQVLWSLLMTKTQKKSVGHYLGITMTIQYKCQGRDWWTPFFEVQVVYVLFYCILILSSKLNIKYINLLAYD